MQRIGEIRRWLCQDYTTLPIATASIPFVADAKQITPWELGRTLYAHNDGDLIPTMCYYPLPFVTTRY